MNGQRLIAAEIIRLLHQKGKAGQLYLLLLQSSLSLKDLDNTKHREWIYAEAVAHEIVSENLALIQLLSRALKMLETLADKKKPNRTEYFQLVVQIAARLPSTQPKP